MLRVVFTRRLNISRFIVFLMVVVFPVNKSSAINPSVSKFMVNLSDSIDKEALWDHCPEMVIEGNTIHLIWSGFKSEDSPLYYCRSLDLGKSWEKPRILARSRDIQNVRESRNRRLAVDGNNVHIVLYNYESNFYGKLSHIVSTDGGATFSSPKELVSSFTGIQGYQIRSVNGKVAIAYVGNDSSSGSRKGLYLLFSDNGGASFADQKVYQTSNRMVDFFFEGNQLIILTSYYRSGDYGDYYSQVFASVSNDKSATFNTQVISNSNNGEKCVAGQVTDHYVSKIAKSGNNIHIVFSGYNESKVFTTLYVRSVNNGATFEPAKDINGGVVASDQINTYLESIAAKNGHVYIIYHSKAGQVYFVSSENNGESWSLAKGTLPDGTASLSSTWYPSIVLDPNDNTGLSFYITGNVPLSLFTGDGGKTFGKYTISYPFHYYITHSTAYLAVDKSGDLHWVADMKYIAGSDQDIFYRRMGREPLPESLNKSYAVETQRGVKYETLIVPSSQSIEFDSVMTAEAWVKFRPDQTLYEVNILAKINGKDGSDYNPSGYQLGFRVRDGNMCVNSGLETDKGDFMNWGGCIPYDTLWHHVAFTYVAGAGANNFKTYMDGKLQVQTTVTGKITPGKGLLIFGSRGGFDTSTKFELDDVRLWNRALSQEELMKNQVSALTGKEAGLQLFLNFNGTFKDISGNRNDAVPVYLGNLIPSNFNPPVTEFDLYSEMSKVTLTNKTTNGKTWSWEFGDGKTSAAENPVYTYSKAGEFTILLQGKNANSVTAMLKKVTIAGLDRIEPSTAGSGEFATISIFGGGINNKATARLVKGSVVIAADTSAFIKSGEMKATFDLYGQAVGKYDVVVNISGTEYTLKEALTVEQGVVAGPYLYISGRNTVLLNRWYTKTITFGNNGNVDLYNIPLFIAISDIPGLEVEFINADIRLNSFFKDPKYKSLVDTIPLFIVKKDFFAKGQSARVYPFFVGTLVQGTSQSIQMRIKSPEKYNMEAQIFGFPDEKTLKSNRTRNLNLLGNCMWDAWVDNLITAGGMLLDMASETLPLACIKSIGLTMYNTKKGYDENASQKTILTNAFWDLTSVALNCAGDLYPPAKAYKVGLNLLDNFIDLGKSLYNYYDCFKYAWYKDSTFTVSSFDPNEMSGPSGFGDKNWIQKNKEIPYTVLFENKSTATAPAHEVVVTDTLDMKKFDFDDFGFGAFGFGDTTLFPNGNKLKKFAKDVDLRPGKNLMVRVTGTLDTVKGIVRCEFLSLNPVTLEYDDDPLSGFLPPNNASHAGEGFVSFTVGLKKELVTGSDLKNRASIVFDANKPILTNNYLNTLDADKPESRVSSIEPAMDSRFPVSWDGNDTGSGISGYSVYVLENDTALKPLVLDTKLKSIDFEGKVGSKYKFYSVATDNVSLMESRPGTYDAFTSITVNTDEFELKKEKIRVFPNPVSDMLNVVFQAAPCGAYVVETVGMNGNRFYSALHDSYDLSSGVKIGTKDYPPGNYVVRIIFGNKTVSRMITVR